VIVLTPCYQSLLEVARTVGCRVTPWTLRREGRGWRLDLDQLATLVTDETRVLVVNFPHNPTGFLPSLHEWQALLDFARARALYLFSDEMYRGLELDPDDRLPAACDEYEKAISLAGLSKAFGAPGLRIGWLATRDHSLVDRWLELKDYLTICSSAPSEVLALCALRAREQLIERNRMIVAGNLQLAGEFFARDEFEWLPPRAGSIAFPVWKGPISLDALCTRALERGLMIVPGTMFDFPGDHFRVGLGRKDFPRALEELRACLDPRPQAA
jgi:aspartate/methionine/tyrosine aminotransferase